MRAVTFTEEARAGLHMAAGAKGFSTDFVDGCLEAIGLDIGKGYDTLILRPPDHPERRLYLRRAEALGLVQAVCELQEAGDVIVIRLSVEAFS